MKVLIVGAGVSGLTTLKECLARGFSASIFEAQAHSGGQWRYTEPDPETGEVHSSMYNGCIFNSCRDTSAFSDFPLDPARYPQYFGHAAFIRYLEDYATFFNLEKHIRYNSKVLKCEQMIGGAWKVSWESNSRIQTDTFDALFACTGHLWNPSTPKFEGLSDFKGNFQHSHTYRTPGPFEGKRVAVIGIGSSAVDIASEISPQTQECHLITRTGGWIIPRFVLGKPVEAWDSRLTTYLPLSVSQWMQQALLGIVEGQLPAELRPEHKLLEANPTVRSDFVEKVKVGMLTPHRTGIERFTEDGLIMTNGEKLEVDAVISCTGYHIDFPYLPSDSYRTNDSKFIDSSNSVDLYELIVPPYYQNLFFIGLVESFGPGIPVFESQARWSVGVLSGAITLPEPTEMKKWAKEFQAHLAERYVHSARHTITVDCNVSYMDQLAKPLDANPSLGRLLRRIFTSNPFNAFSILSSVYLDVSSSSQFRLFGVGACPELAAASILRIARGKKELSEDERLGLQKLKAEWDEKHSNMGA